MADGLLSDIFGAIDRAKRGVSTRYNMLMDNPREYLAQIQERARDFDRTQQAGIPGLLAQYTGAPVTPEQQRAAQYANQQMQDVALGFAAPTTYHGSPHIFNKFDLSKIGTGEGQQIIAPGTYLSQSKDFAKGFMQDQRGQAAPTIANKYLKNWGDNNLAIQKLDERYKTLLNESNPNFAQPYKDAADMLRKGETEFGGSLYKVNLPDSKARRMLDYDKELKNQPKHIRNIAIKNGVDLNDTGFDLLQKIGRDQVGADKLKNAGIPGIKYSNEMIPGTNNYVVFDPNYLKILERNNKPIK